MRRDLVESGARRSVADDGFVAATLVVVVVVWPIGRELHTTAGALLCGGVKSIGLSLSLI